METLAVTFYNVVVWLHVSAVVVAFGPTFAFGIYYAVAERKYPRALPAIREATITINRSMVTLGAIVIFLSGLYLASRVPWSFSDFFVIWGLLAIIVLMGLAHGFFLPNDQRALRLEARHRGVRPHGRRPVQRRVHEELTGRNARMGPVAGLIVILTIYVMAAKPFL